MPRFVVALALLAAACESSVAPAPPELPATVPTTRPPTAATKHEARERTEQGSRFQVGDYVVYRYTGSFTNVPIVLRQRVTQKDMFRLVIDVIAERGDERRQWMQVVTDTPDNREKNVIDELYEIANGDRRRLENVDNHDLYRLYEWTTPPCKGDTQDAGKVDLELTVAGAKYDCTCKKVLRECAGVRAQLETCECPEFVWTYASGEARALDETTTIWKSTVEKFGNARM